MRETSLSVSSTTSQSSISTTGSYSPHALSRKGVPVASPPPSPGLADYMSRHGKRPISSSRGRLRRLFMTYHKSLFSVLGLAALTLLLLRSFVADYQRAKDTNFDYVDQSHLPKQPSALIVHDTRGHSKWTVWIPPTSPFPLRPWDYSEICAQVEEIEAEFSSKKRLFTRRKSYYSVDPHFVDVAEAFSSGLLPPIEKSTADDLDIRATCKKSLTFVMETDDAGIGNSLLAVWSAYGLAQKEGRAFFVDDSKWSYGNFSTYFKPPPDPACRPPPSNHRVPCPRSAAHLVISQATFKYAFGSLFQSEFLDSSRTGQDQQHQIYDLARAGYQALFHLADRDDAAYVQTRVAGELFTGARKHGGMAIGLHVRRGDLHPLEAEFRHDYLPLARYVDEATAILTTTYGHASSHSEQDVAPHHDSAATTQPSPSSWAKTQPTHHAPPALELLRKRHSTAAIAASTLLLASDDPLVHSAPELTSARAHRAQARIMLASQSDLEAMMHAGKGAAAAVPLDDRPHGWEGGFFARAFWALGAPARGRPRMMPRPTLRGRAVESEAHARLSAAPAPAPRPATVPLEQQQRHMAAAPAPPGSAPSSAPAAEDGHHHHEQHHHHVAGHHPAHGGLHPLAAQRAHRLADARGSPSAQALRLRAVLGRAYLLDLAVLARADAVVCGAGSAACRALGVMLGWDKVAGGAWRNVDGGVDGWHGLLVR